VATRSDQKQGLDIQPHFSTWNPLSSLKPSSLSQLTHPHFSWSQPPDKWLKSFSPCCDCSILVISSQQSVNGVNQSENRIQTVVQFDWLIRLALLLPDIVRTLKVTAWLAVLCKWNLADHTLSPLSPAFLLCSGVCYSLLTLFLSVSTGDSFPSWISSFSWYSSLATHSCWLALGGLILQISAHL